MFANTPNYNQLIRSWHDLVLLDTITGKKPRGIGVIFKDENGKKHKAMLSKTTRSEIIVTSGAIGSPHLLLLSGIGPKAELEKFKIPVVLDNEFVGKGMSDNPMNTIFVPSKKPVKPSLIQTVGITKLGVYIEASSGFGQSTDSIHCDHGIASAEVGSIIQKCCSSISCHALSINIFLAPSTSDKHF